MSRIVSFALALSCLSAIGCGDPPPLEGDDLPDDPAADGGIVDATFDASETGGPDTDGDAPDAGSSVLRFIEPMGEAFASSQTLPIQAISSVVLDRVDVLVDGVLVANLDVPYAWELTTYWMSVGTHTITPRGHIGATVFDGEPFTLTIDRTPTPGIDASRVTSAVAPKLGPDARTPIEVAFDEPLLASSAETIGMTVKIGSAVVAGTTSVSGEKVVFTPTLRWPEAATVNVSLAGAVRDRAGNVTPVSVAAALGVGTYWAPEGHAVGMYGPSAATLRDDGDFLFVGYSYPSPWTAALVIYGEIDGVAVTPPPLDPVLPMLDEFVDGGLDADGVAYVLLHEGNNWFEQEALSVARRDPVTGAWTKQALSTPPGDDYTQHVYNASLVVAANGHAYVRYDYWDGSDFTAVTLHRGPADAAFTPTAELDDLVLDDTLAFPGTAGRACAASAQGVAPGDTAFDYVVACRGGGLPPATIPVGARLPAPARALAMRSNAHGDAIVLVGTQAYRFDGATESVSAPATLPTPSDTVLTKVAAALNSDGEACFGYATLGVQTIEVRTVRQAASGVLTSATTVLAEPRDGEIAPPTMTVAEDALGHCFVSIGHRRLVHDATADGAWTMPFTYASDGTGSVYAGAASQAFITVGGTARRFVPLP